MIIDLTSQWILIGAVLALLCVVTSIVSRKLGAPILLIFLVLGMVAGEDGLGGIQFNDFGVAFLIGNLALAIIIFDGGLGTRKDTFRVSLMPALSLATVGVVLTAGITGAAVYWLLDLPLHEALLIGAIVGSTDAAAVFGLLRFAGLELKERTSATLEIESGTNDPMAIFLTVTLVQLLAVDGANIGVSILVALAQQLGLGLTIGLAGGHLLVFFIKRLKLSVSLYPLFALAGGLSIFGVTNLWGGSGFLAIYLVGVMVGNAPLPHSNDIHRFHDGIAWLSQIGMFLMLGLLITPNHLPPIILPATAIAIVLIFVARPVAVIFSLLPFHFPWREQVFISACGLRGAVPIILALFPSLAGLEHTTIFFEIVFFVVLISLIIQGWSIAPLARWLRIDLPPHTREPEHWQHQLPTEHEKVLHVYDVPVGCNAIGMSTQRLPLSEGSQLMGIVRDGINIPQNKATHIQAHDQVVILGSHGPTSFGALFSLPGTSHKTSTTDFFFGEFSVFPEATLGDLSEVYGFEISADQKTESIAHYFNHKFHNKPVVGDRVTLGKVQFVVKEIHDQRITAVGVKLNNDG